MSATAHHTTRGAPASSPGEAALRAILRAEMARRRAEFGRVVHYRDGWRIDVRPHGYIYSHGGEQFGARRELADAILTLIRAEIDRGTPEAEAVAPYLSRSIATLYTRWLEVKRAEVAVGKRSPGTVREYARYAREAGEVAWWGDRSLAQVSTGALEEWELWMAGRGLSPKTRANVLGAFRAFFGWLHRRVVVQHVPPFPRIERDHHAPAILGPEVQAGVLGAIPEPERGIYLALALMGLRPGEARALDASDYRRGELTVARAMQGLEAGARVGPTKTRRTRVLPIAPELEGWIAAHVPAEARLERAPLFVNPRTGRRWSHWALRMGWVRGCEAAGLEAVPLYEGTKHSFATDALDRTGDERAVQEYLGHADARSTRRYAQLQRRALVRVVSPRGMSGD